MNANADIVLALVVMGGLGALAFRLGIGMARRLSPRWLAFAGFLLVGLAVLSIYTVTDSAILVWCLPLQAVAVYGQLEVIPGGMIMGLVWSQACIPRWRRLLLAAALGGVLAWAVIGPVVAAAPTCRSNWEGDVCLQTREGTCSAAAVATLLRHHGIPASEGEIATLAFSTEEGTRLPGVYRALRIKTANMPFQVRVRQGGIPDLRRLSGNPAVVSVGLRRSVATHEPRYARDWGWTAGQRHSVVFLGFADEQTVLIADPSVGRERWDLAAFLDLWVGDLVYLETNPGKGRKNGE